MKTCLQACRTTAIAVTLGTLCFFSAGSARADVNTYKQTLKATTWVLAKGSDGLAKGTGVLIDSERKLVLTNFHVVSDARTAVLFFPEMEGDNPIVSGQHYLDNVKRLGIRGRVIAVDRKRDLALIQIDRIPAGAEAIKVAEQSIGPGEAVESVGNPGASGALWVYTSGTVRSVYQKQYRTGAGEHNFKLVETQSPINSGDSGGPVVNSAGELVAVAQAFAPNARLVSYCVDISEVKAFLASPWKLAPLPVTDVLTRAELEYTQHPTGHYEVKFDQDKQKQSVFITKDVEYYERADVRKIWSLATATKVAPNLETAMKLLQQNARTKLGAWTIEQTQEGEFMIIYCLQLDATATPDTVKSAMEYVARLTAAMKKELIPKAKAEKASDTLEDWLKK